MKKIQIIIMLIMVAVLTLGQEGCESGENGKNGDKVNTFIGGTTGLNLQYAEGAPPEEIFDNKQWTFDVEVKLKNVGEADINSEDVVVKLTGLNPLDFGKTESDFVKDGISEDIPATKKDFEGNIIDSPDVFVTFSGLTYQSALPGNQKLQVRADVCYKYQTQAVAFYCVREDVLSVDKDAVCQITGEKIMFNSGGPIQVTAFSEQPSGSDKIRYLFTIKHQGTGRYYLPSSKCPAGRVAENKIHFKIETDEDLTCNGLIDGTGTEGDILLNNGERVIQCVQNTGVKTDYEDTLNVILTYDYKQYFDQELLVKKSI
jgi:hypothetical protein